MKLVDIRRVGTWFAIRAFCPCTCGSVIRSAFGSSLKGALYRFRFARREALLVEEALT